MMLTRTREQWISLLQGPGIPCSPVHNLGELVQHPHTEASDMILQYRNDEGRCLNAVATPLRAAGERSLIRRNPPRLGQHSKEILSDYGFDAAQVDDLVARAIVFSAEPPAS